MSSFCAAKVVPECLLSPSHVLITQISKNVMDSSSSRDVLVKPALLPDDTIIPMILTFEKKITLNQGLISTTADHEGPISHNPAGNTNNEDDYDEKQVISSSSAYQASASLWPKLTELDDHPSKPPYQDAIKQVRRESAYLFPKQSEHYDRPPSPSSFETELGNRPSSPSYKNVNKIRESAYQSPNEAELDACKSLSADYEDSGKPKMQVIREAAYHDKLSEMKESYRRSPMGRLSRVVEESESFSRREFGANVLNYMSTHSSANHAANISSFSYKHPSYNHNNHTNFSYNHSSYKSGTFSSKSAPAGTAVRTGSAFALFRRGTSEGGNLGADGRVYRRPRSRKPRSLTHTLLWPLLKIRNGYVGCMMGLEGTGDLSGMAQGGTYATKARFFADVPLSKSDSRNFG